MALRSLLRRTPALGRTGRPVHALSPAAGPRLMSQNRSDLWFYSEEVLAGQREKIDRLRADYNEIRRNLNQDMDTLLELMRRESGDLSRFHKRLNIFENAIHVVFLGFPVALVILCMKYELNVLDLHVLWPIKPSKLRNVEGPSNMEA